MRIIAKRTLRQFWETHPRGAEAKAPLQPWHSTVAGMDWALPADVKATYSDASILKNSRVVFNIGGNKYRLVARINYQFGIVYVRFVGTHEEYDGIDAETNRRRDHLMNLEIRPIRDEADFDAALSAINALMGAEPGTPEGDRLDVLVTLIESYEAKHWAIDPPDPLEAIRLRMEQKNLRQRDLEPMIGSRGRVSEVLSGKRSLTLAMIRRLAKGLDLSPEILIQEISPRPA